MNFRKIFSFVLAALLLVSTSAFAGDIAVQEDGTQEKAAVRKLNFSTGLDLAVSNGVATITANPSDISSAVFEGSTADAYETTLDVVDPTADNTFRLPDASGYALYTSLATNKADAANSVWGVSNGLVFEGATADGFETTVSPVDPTADRTISLPNGTGSVEVHAATVVITAGASPTLTVPVGVDFIATDTITTDNQDQTITFSSGGTLGQKAYLLFQTDSGGSGDEVITFETTLVNSAGTLTLANLTAGRYSVVFQSDGTVWNEISRTAALS